jgi:prophage regulatory protein
MTMPETTTPNAERHILRSREVCRRVGLSVPTIWRLRQRGDFPAPIKITSRVIGYDSIEIDNWLAARARA